MYKRHNNSNLNFLPRNWTNGILPKSTLSFQLNNEEYIFKYSNTGNFLEIYREHFERISLSKIEMIKVIDNLYLIPSDIDIKKHNSEKIIGGSKLKKIYENESRQKWKSVRT